MRRTVLAMGACGVAAGLALVLIARALVPGPLYVSGMGAPDMPTAGAFMAALVLIAIGGGMIGAASRRVRSRFVPPLRPAYTILASSACFLFASQVTCTPGCPLPFGPTFTWQDFLHTSAAVLGFALACLAMLQAAFSDIARPLRAFSLTASCLVAIVALAGAQFALFGYLTDLGGALEFVATGIGLLWIAVYGVALAIGGSRAHAAAVGEVADRTPATGSARAGVLAGDLVPARVADKGSRPGDRA